jgi:hypothetical protein
MLYVYPILSICCLRFPGVEVGDTVSITAQEFIDTTFNAPFRCEVISFAQAFQTDVVKIHRLSSDFTQSVSNIVA